MVIALSMVAACSSSDLASDTTAAPVTPTTTADATTAATAATTTTTTVTDQTTSTTVEPGPLAASDHGSSVAIPATSIHPDGTGPAAITIDTLPADTARTAAGAWIAAGSRVEVVLTGSELVGPATLNLAVPAAYRHLGELGLLFAVTAEPGSGDQPAQIVNGTYDPTTSTLQVTTTHFSIWDLAVWPIETVFDTIEDGATQFARGIRDLGRVGGFYVDRAGNAIDAVTHEVLIPAGRYVLDSPRRVFDTLHKSAVVIGDAIIEALGDLTVAVWTFVKAYWDKWYTEMKTALSNWTKWSAPPPTCSTTGAPDLRVTQRRLGSDDLGVFNLIPINISYPFAPPLKMCAEWDLEHDETILRVSNQRTYALLLPSSADDNGGSDYYGLRTTTAFWEHESYVEAVAEVLGSISQVFVAGRGNSDIRIDDADIHKLPYVINVDPSMSGEIYEMVILGLSLYPPTSDAAGLADSTFECIYQAGRNAHQAFERDPTVDEQQLAIDGTLACVNVLFAAIQSELGEPTTLKGKVPAGVLLVLGVLEGIPTAIKDLQVSVDFASRGLFDEYAGVKVAKARAEFDVFGRRLPPAVVATADHLHHASAADDRRFVEEVATDGEFIDGVDGLLTAWMASRPSSDPNSDLRQQVAAVLELPPTRASCRRRVDGGASSGGADGYEYSGNPRLAATMKQIYRDLRDLDDPTQPNIYDAEEADLLSGQRTTAAGNLHICISDDGTVESISRTSETLTDNPLPATPPADPAEPGYDPLTAVAGTWAGPVIQPASPRYSTTMTLRAGAELGQTVGTIDYPELNCTGKLTLAANGDTGPVVVHEQITAGDGCFPDGDISLLVNPDGTLDWAYLQNAGTVSAKATLTHPPPLKLAGIVGTWAGPVTQPDVTGYRTTMVITTGSAPVNATVGTIDYPDLGCGGHLELVEDGPDHVTLREIIDHGSRCLNGGHIVLHRNPDGTLAWRYAGDGFQASATLTATDPSAPPGTTTAPDVFGPLLGVWKGPVVQPNSPAYSTVMTLTNTGPAGSQVGTIDYPELQCGGHLDLIRNGPTDVQLLETITYGTRCIATVTLTIRPNSDGTLDYKFSSLFTSGTATLTR